MQYYRLSPFLLLCYLHEPLVVKTVELHKLFLYARYDHYKLFVCGHEATHT